MTQPQLDRSTQEREAPAQGVRAQVEHQAELADAVQTKAQRRLAAADKRDRSLWFGLGAFGLIGWSVAVPTLIGIALGFWLDLIRDDSFSWTLALLLAGVVVGAFNAWYWMNKEQQQMEADRRLRRRNHEDGAP